MHSFNEFRLFRGSYMFKLRNLIIFSILSLISFNIFASSRFLFKAMRGITPSRMFSRAAFSTCGEGKPSFTAQFTADRHHIFRPQHSVMLNLEEGFRNPNGFEWRLPHLYCMEVKYPLGTSEELQRYCFLDYAEEHSLTKKGVGKRNLWKKYFDLQATMMQSTLSVDMQDAPLTNILSGTDLSQAEVLKEKIILSKRVSKILRSIYRKDLTSENLTAMRVENKFVVPLLIGQRIEFDLFDKIESSGGKVECREGPKDGCNVTLTWIGPTLLIHNPRSSTPDKLRFRVRAYGDVNNGQVELQRSDNKVWFEAKIALGDESKEHRWGTVTRKIRVLVSLDKLNELLVLANSGVGIEANSEIISQAINNIFYKALDDPENDASDVVNLHKILKSLLYEERYLPEFRAAIYVTRSARVLCLPDRSILLDEDDDQRGFFIADDEAEVKHKHRKYDDEDDDDQGGFGGGGLVSGRSSFGQKTSSKNNGKAAKGKAAKESSQKSGKNYGSKKSGFYDELIFKRLIKEDYINRGLEQDDLHFENYHNLQSPYFLNKFSQSFLTVAVFGVNAVANKYRGINNNL